ncbi:MAG: acyl carrier protein [Porticoccaceae bacterium]|jgi:acyl carrier protein|nr:acyl carrier protein [Porticoccaceae bacterium]
MDDTHQSLVEKTVCEFISKNPSAKSSPVDITYNLAELNIDSLEKLSIGMDLEEEFAIEFSDEDIEAFATVSDIVTAVDLAIAAKPAPIASMQTS